MDFLICFHFVLQLCLFSSSSPKHHFHIMGKLNTRSFHFLFPFSLVFQFFSVFLIPFAFAMAHRFSGCTVFTRRQHFSRFFLVYSHLGESNSLHLYATRGEPSLPSEIVVSFFFWKSYQSVFQRILLIHGARKNAIRINCKICTAPDFCFFRCPSFYRPRTYRLAPGTGPGCVSTAPA